ncbi:MAG TPA: hypothetical protein VI756_17510, partial [Blastocatellia bacterium]
VLPSHGKGSHDDPTRLIGDDRVHDRFKNRDTVIPKIRANLTIRNLAIRIFDALGSIYPVLISGATRAPAPIYGVYRLSVAPKVI